MKKGFRLQEKVLYGMVNALLLLGICLFGIGRTFGIAIPTIWHALVGTVVLMALTAFGCMEIKGRLLSFVGMLGCLGTVIIVAGAEISVAFLRSYGNWLLGITPWQQEWLAGYEILQSVLIALICYLLQLVLGKDFRVKTAVALLVVAALVFSCFAEKEISHVGVGLGICYLVMVVMEAIQRNWKKEKTKSLQSYMLWMVPFLLIYLWVLLWMPVPDKPYDWKFFKEIYNQISESVKAASHSLLNMGREDFGSSLSGFSAEGRVGDGVQKEIRKIMTIQSNASLRTNVYLTGKVYDTFDGLSWQKVNSDVAQERYIDAMNTLYAVQSYDKEYQEDYLRRSTLIIRYEDFRSRYLFAPLKTWKLEHDGRGLGYEEVEGSLQFPEKVGYGTEYVVTYYQLNMGQEAFYEFLEAEPEIPDTVISEQEWEAYERLIYQNYLETVELSEDIERYLEQWTQDAETDVEKLRAIEAMLCSMTYTNAPGAMPDTVADGGSFLEYFLLEGRQGYCSHFATAFVLLARAEGIPARYVQGYCVPMEANEEKVVTSDRAHAWPEVYIDHIGWIAFEPTPGYGEVRYTPWKIKKGETIVSSNHTSGPNLPMREEHVPEDANQEQMEAEAGQEGNTLRNLGKILKIGLVAASLVVIIAVIALLLERLVNRMRYRRMSETQKYKVEIQRNMRIFSWLLLERQEGETLEELQRRVNDSLEGNGEICFVEEYEAFLYGDRCVDEGMLRLAVEEREGLLHILKQKRKWTYFYYCIFVK